MPVFFYYFYDQFGKWESLNSNHDPFLATA